MKLLLSLVAFSCFLFSCANHVTSHPDPAQYAREAKAKVKRGMSKSQVRSILGTPTNTISTGTGETWTYLRSDIENKSRQRAAVGAIPVVGVFMAQNQAANAVHTTAEVVVRFSRSGRVSNVRKLVGSRKGPLNMAGFH